MPTTTPSGRTRLPTLGDVPDIPADLLNLAYDLEMLVDAQHPNKWIKRGRVDRKIEGNGNLRITDTECFFNGSPPGTLILNGIDERFYAAWNGQTDGSGCLVGVWTLNGTRYGSGLTVAANYVAIR